MAEKRRSIFATGGGPPPVATVTDEAMEAILSDQFPIKGVYDDDHADSDAGGTNNEGKECYWYSNKLQTKRISLLCCRFG